MTLGAGSLRKEGLDLPGFVHNWDEAGTPLPGPKGPTSFRWRSGRVARPLAVRRE